MLIHLSELDIKTPIKGIIHIGAHTCEERDAYRSCLGIGDAETIWIEAIPELVDRMKDTNPSVQIYNACITDADDHIVSFMMTNNYQSSSVLKLKTHLTEHPNVRATRELEMKTTTLDTFFRTHGLNPSDYNFMNIDIQGAELLALGGAGSVLPHIDYIYCEVNEDELYEGCARLPDVDAFMSKNGFSRTHIYMTPHGWGDAFYARH